jgi:large subunit ribosomal protein L22
MAAGPKLNEASHVMGERSGTRSSAKYVRSSAYKARVVLDLIRGQNVRRADEILQFTDRGIAVTVRKVLASAVANAVHNDEQDPDELFVKACFADEGPTLRRFRPRARGRASRIRKRTSHITIIVARMSDQQLGVLQAKENAAVSAGRGRAASATAARRARVEASRRRAAVRKAGSTTAEDAPTDDVVEDAIDTTEVEGTEVVAGEWSGSALPEADGSGPEGYDIKGNADSMLYHLPGTSHYDRTIAEVYFDTAESAEAAGFSLPKSQQEDADEASDTDAAADESGEEN